MDDELHHPLRVLRERLRASRGCRSRRGRRSGSAAKKASTTAVVRGTRGRLRIANAPRNTSASRSATFTSPAPGTRPVHLLERAARRASRGRGSSRRGASRRLCSRRGGRPRQGDRRHARSRRSSRSTSSSTRVRRETLSRHSSVSSGAASCARAPAVAQRRQLARDPVDVVGRDDDAGARVAQQPRRGAVGRHEREDRPLGGEVLEHLPGEHAAPAAVGLGDQQQQRLGVALQLERAAVRRVRDQLDPVGDARRPLAVGSRGSRRRTARRRRRPARAR